MASWKIESMAIKPQDNSYVDVVITAEWHCIATNGQITVSNVGSMGFASPTGNFIPYSDLTEADVLGWVWANGVNKTETEANVDLELQMQINPSVVPAPLPWS